MNNLTETKYILPESNKLTALPKECFDKYDETCNLFKVHDIGEVDDGFHSFNSLYEQRAYLFAALVNTYKDKAWKTKFHENNEPCFGGGWFLVTIDTPKGSYGYHFEMKYWDLFDCVELDKAKHWDGYTDKDVSRLLSLKEIR